MKVKIDISGDNVFVYNNEKTFICDAFAGLPSEGELSRIYKELPEIDIIEKTEFIIYEGKEYKADYRLGDLPQEVSGNFEYSYDSTGDTCKHILRINEEIHRVCKNFLDRADKHDRSKLSTKEKHIFDIYTPKLKTSVYGSEEYKSYLSEMKVALDNHYEENKNHHPDKLPKGIQSMSLLDLTEMLIDWKCASERHETGSIFQSIISQKTRFNLPDNLIEILFNTVIELKLYVRRDFDNFIGSKDILADIILKIGDKNKLDLLEYQDIVESLANYIPLKFQQK